METLDILADAIKLLLADPPQSQYRYLGDRPERGEWHGTVKKLLGDLCSCRSYHRVADRPHDDRELRAFLKKNAVKLHERGVIITLNGTQIAIEKA
jgi:hypothetical protein